MLKQMSRLFSVSICNLFGINEVIHTRDRKKKRNFILMAVLWLMLIVMAQMYLIGTAVAYMAMGMGDILPMYFYTVAAMLTLVFTFFKAGSVIFAMNTYEMLMALPVTKTAIVVSRFLTMYVTNLIMSLLIMIPGLLLYGIRTGQGALLYVFYIIGTLFLPLLPMTVATAISAVIKWISTKMKHKSLVEALLTLALTVGIILLSTMTRFEGDPQEVFANLTNVVRDAVEKIFPPAAWFGAAVVEGDILWFLLLIGVSIAVFALLVVVLNACFTPVCTALNTAMAKHNYKKVKGNQNSVFGTLLTRELRYYFSHSVYMVNTIMGPVLMLVAAIALVVVGPDSINGAIPIEGAVEKALPFVLTLCAIMMPTTACAVSLEGKNRWLTKSLPIPVKAQYDGKIALFLLICLPFYLLSVIISAVGLGITGLSLVWLIVVPAAGILFGANLGITMNLMFPVFDWDNEVKVVKQSASSGFTMLVGMILMVVFGGLALALPNYHAVNLAVTLIFLLISAWMYRRNSQKEI